MSTAIYLIGAAQAFFLVVLLLSKKQKQLADYCLSLWLLLLGAHLAIFYKAEIFGASEWLWKANAGISLVQGPFLYLYSRSLIKPELSYKESLHFVPFVGHLIVSGTSFTLWFDSFQLLVAISFGTYLLLNLRQLIEYRHYIKRHYANLEKVSLRWLWILTISLTAVLILVILQFAMYMNSEEPNHNPIFMAIGLLVLIIGYFGLSQGKLLVETELPYKKYAKSSLNEDQMKTIIEKLDHVMRDQRLFLNEDLNLAMLATTMNMAENDISQSFGEADTNFYEFINKYRVKYAQQLLSAKEHNHLSLLGIAYESGFQSKTTFNRAFKKFTELTPSAYKKKLDTDKINESNECQ